MTMRSILFECDSRFFDGNLDNSYVFIFIPLNERNSSDNRFAKVDVYL